MRYSNKFKLSKVLAFFMFSFPFMLWAQQTYEPFHRDTVLSQSWIRDYFSNPVAKARLQTFPKKTAIVYFRPEYRYTQDANKLPNADFGLTSVRLDIRGPIIPNKLDFRFRNRYYPTVTAEDRLGYNRINFSLDYLYINWHITPQISLMAGKNLRLYGGFEWDMAPFIINQYNQYLLSVENFFPIGVQARFQIAKGNSIVAGVYQAANKTMKNRELATGFNLQDQKATRFPVGVGALWRGSLFGGKIRTIWGVFGEQNLLNQMNVTAIFGQRYVNDWVNIFVDYTIANMPTDLTTLSSSLDKLYKKKTFATNVLYQVVSARMDLNLSKKKNWVLVFTGEYERGTQKQVQYTGFSNDDVRNWRQIWLGNLQLEYFPIKGQDLRFYIFAQRRYDIFNSALINKGGLSNTSYNSAGVGVIYSLPLL